MPNESATLSFRPSTRKTKLWGRLTGLLLIVSALSGAYLLYQHDRAQYPALVSGQTTTGILNDFVKKPDGTHGVLVLVAKDSTTKSVTTNKAVEGDPQDLGRPFTIHYVGADYRAVFIDGIDQIAYTVWGFGAAAGGLLFGLILLVVPFKVRTRR